MFSFAYDYGNYYQVIVTDGTDTNSFSYDFGKEQDIEVSIKESVLLAQLEIDRRNPVPIAI